MYFRVKQKAYFYYIFVFIAIWSPAWGQCRFYISENDCSSCTSQFVRIITEKPISCKFEVYSVSKNFIFLKDIIERVYGMDSSQYLMLLDRDNKLRKFPLSTIIDATGKEWNAKSIGEREGGFFYSIVPSFKVVPFPFGRRTRMRCGSSSCVITSYSNGVAYSLSWNIRDEFSIRNLIPKSDSLSFHTLGQIGLLEYLPEGILNVDSSKLLLSQRYLFINRDITEVRNRYLIYRTGKLSQEVTDTNAFNYEDGYFDNRKILSDADLNVPYSLPVSSPYFRIICDRSDLLIDKAGRATLKSKAGLSFRIPFQNGFGYKSLISDGTNEYLLLQKENQLFVYCHRLGKLYPFSIIQLGEKNTIVAADVSNKGDLVLLDDQNRAAIISILPSKK